MKKIHFIARNIDVYNCVTAPKPSIQYMPKWYKETKKFLPKPNNKVHLNTRKTIKACIPVFDSMSYGYIQESWCDIYVDFIDEQIIFKPSLNEIPILGQRELSAQGTINPPTGFNKQLFNFTRPWIPKTPKGYSVLYVHPFYHTDLPFLVMPGIVDSDVFQGAGAASPAFFLKEGFSGIIPKGTPLYQIIPIKKESWKSEIKNFESGEKLLRKNFLLIESMFNDRYKKMFWNKISFK